MLYLFLTSSDLVVGICAAGNIGKCLIVIEIRRGFCSKNRKKEGIL